jgi:hypothetical protein
VVSELNFPTARTLIFGAKQCSLTPFMCWNDFADLYIVDVVGGGKCRLANAPDCASQEFDEWHLVFHGSERVHRSARKVPERKTRNTSGTSESLGQKSRCASFESLPEGIRQRA